MSIGVVLIGIFSIFWPEVMKPFAPKIPTLLGIIMFGMGMSLTPGDFKNVFKQPKNVAIGTVLQFIIMPAAAFAPIHLFALPPEIAIGVVLVGCCPGGTASNVISYIAKADVALSVSMTMVWMTFIVDSFPEAGLPVKCLGECGSFHQKNRTLNECGFRNQPLPAIPAWQEGKLKIHPRGMHSDLKSLHSSRL